MLPCGDKKIRAHLFSIFFVLNVYTCFNGNKTATKYELEPPTIQQYLHGPDGNADYKYDGDDSDDRIVDILNQ
jgi:hypothetical protein